MDVVIDGVAYAPVAKSVSQVGVAITTHDRPDVFAQALEHQIEHLPTGAILVVVDDGSNTPATVPADVQLFRFDSSRGIVAAKNKCLEVLMDAGCEHLFLFDDDAWPIKDGWELPYVASSEPHLSYQFLDLKMPPLLHDICMLYRDDGHVAYSGQRGVMLYYRRSAIEAVGGFDQIFQRGMYEHSDLANRIHDAGLTTWRYADVDGSDELIHSMDEWCEVRRSVPKDERKRQVARNASIHNRRRSERCSAYAHYRDRRNVVITTLYGKEPDPQRPGSLMRPEDVDTLRRSVAGADFVVISDLDMPGAIKSALGGMNVFFKRWMDYYRYLRDHKEIDFVACLDATDTEMLHEPWDEMERGTLYVGWEPDTLQNSWLSKNHPDPEVQRTIAEHPKDQLLNAGVILGDRETVMRFCHAMTEHYFDRKMLQFFGKDTEGDDLGDMGALQVEARRFNFETGSKVTTVFKANQREGNSWIRHK